MAKLDIRVFGDPVLRQATREVTEFDAGLRRLADDMLETMRLADGVGLAANQVGVLKSLFTWEIAPEDAEARHGAVVNPEVLETSEDMQENDEGCLSFPGLYYPLERPLRAKVRYQDVSGDEHNVEVGGFMARVFLHEIDHLNGILFIDHLARHDRKDAMKRMREYRLAQEAGPGDDRIDAASPRTGSLLGRRERRL